jgi:hypothetical protein
VKQKMTTTRYTISNIKQLIDLNGKSVNFQLGFKVKSVSNENFDVLVVTQEMLDSNEPLNYQKSDGEISGQITNENGVYNSYFLCLKSDKPMEVDVTININDLPVSPPPQIQQQQQQKQQLRQEVLIDDDDMVFSKKSVKKSKIDYTTNYLIFGIVLVCLFLLVFGYYYWSKSATSPAPVVIEKNDDLLLKNVTDGFNTLGAKLNEVTSKVTDGLNDGLGKIHHNLTENIQELSGKIAPPAEMSVSTDIGEIKASIDNIKSHLYSQQIQAPPPPSPISTLVTSPLLDLGVTNNADEVLSRINSMKIINKQA